jgi:phage gpG-like protein
MATVAEVTGHLKAMQARAPLATKAAASAMGLLMVAETTLVELDRYTHPPGVPTNSPPGEPPALVSGDLRRSVRMTPPASSGARSAVVVGGTVVYARIQELGGWAGRNHASYLPPRPYLKPASERIIESGKAGRAAVKAFAAALGMTSG